MKALRAFGIFTFGGLSYGLLEIMWRGSTHISMFFVGGLCFLMINFVNEHELFGGNMLLQAPFCAVLVTGAELVSGIFINRALKLNVWDYSDMPFNLWGQICLPFSCIWLLLSIPAGIVSAGLRRVMFGEETAGEMRRETVGEQVQRQTLN